MSRVGSDSSAAKRRHHAAVFAALGDETRLSLVTTLCGGEPRSIAQLTGGSRMTRQAITKHLRVLENAGILDRKSTRLNSSHLVISYAVFCLKKKNRENVTMRHLQISDLERVVR